MILTGGGASPRIAASHWAALRLVATALTPRAEQRGATQPVILGQGVEA